MSGSQSIESAVEQILKNVDLGSIQDERARECIGLLLNLVETLNTELRKAQAEIRSLREQLKNRKGGGGQPASPRGSNSSRSSEKDRTEPGEPGQNTKRSKLDRIAIDRVEVLTVDPAELAPDAQFKGYDEVVVQELRICTDNVKFRKEKFYSASTHQTYLAKLPVGYSGEFGPNVKSLCLMFSHLCNMTEPKIADLLGNLGILISAGSISNLLTSAQHQFGAEKQAIVEAGLGSSVWHHMDDTGTRVDGENQHCQVLCNPLYTAYFTTARKDRMTILDVLRNGRERVFRLNAEALELLRGWKIPERVLLPLGQFPFDQDWSQAELNRRLTEQIPNLRPAVCGRVLASSGESVGENGLSGSVV